MDINGYDFASLLSCVKIQEETLRKEAIELSNKQGGLTNMQVLDFNVERTNLCLASLMILMERIAALEAMWEQRNESLN